MKKQVMLTIAVVMVLVASAVPIFAEDNGTNSTDNETNIGNQHSLPNINWMHVLGRGIAVSTSNATDFHTVRIGIAAVNATSKQFTVGVLYFDGTKYDLNNIQTGNGTVSADIFATQNNTNATTTRIGTISLTLVYKNNRPMWFGSLTLNSATYNVYILDARGIGTRELAHEKIEAVAQYCNGHSEKCVNSQNQNPGLKNAIQNVCAKNSNSKPCSMAGQQIDQQTKQAGQQIDQQTRANGNSNGKGGD